jgi:hypothetical protein
MKAFTVPLTISAALLCAGCPPTIPVKFNRNLAAPVSPRAAAKAIMVRGTIAQHRLKVVTLVVEEGRVRTYIADPDQVRIYLVGFDLKPTGLIRTWAPRGLIDVSVDAQGKPWETVKDVTANVKFIVPFVSSIRYLVFTDNRDISFGTVDTKTAVKTFCLTHSHDADCAEWMRNAGLQK